MVLKKILSNIDLHIFYWPYSGIDMVIIGWIICHIAVNVAAMRTVKSENVCVLKLLLNLSKTNCKEEVYFFSFLSKLLV